MPRTSLTPIPRASLSRETLNRLRRAILDGELPGGTALPEAATAPAAELGADLARCLERLTRAVPA